MASTLRRLCVAACAPLVLALAGCGMNVQTLQPYTPAQGVNSDVGQVRVRNLVIVADAAGQGVISASLITYADDTLTAVGGTPHKSDGSAGSPLVVTATGLPLQLSTETLVVLTEAPLKLAVSSPDLKPGLLAEVTMDFTKSGRLTIVAPVVNSAQPEYRGIDVGK